MYWLVIDSAISVIVRQSGNGCELEQSGPHIYRRKPYPNINKTLRIYVARGKALVHVVNLGLQFGTRFSFNNEYTGAVSVRLWEFSVIARIYPILKFYWRESLWRFGRNRMNSSSLRKEVAICNNLMLIYR